MKWITRSDIKVDRVACPWLIARFLDGEPEFLFGPEAELFRAAEANGATPYDTPRIREVKLNHRGTRCTFDAFVDDDRLSDPALLRLAEIVRSADIRDSIGTAEGPGLYAIAQGKAALGLSDKQRLEAGFRVYDALYVYCGGSIPREVNRAQVPVVAQ